MWPGLPAARLSTTRLCVWVLAGCFTIAATERRAFPLQAVTDWMGNTPKVALRHYLMTTDTHFDAAVRGDEKALQNALQQSHAMGRVEPQPHDPIKKEAPVLQGLAGSCVLAQPPQVAGTGFEPVTSRL